MTKTTQDLLNLVENEPIKIYCGDTKDSINILNWWLDLVQSNEIEKVMFPSCHDLAPFISLFQSKSCALAYNTDEKDKIRLAVWGQQAGPGICWVSVWLRKDFRQSKIALALLIKLYQNIFKVFDIIMGITKQKGLLRVHKTWGYTIVGEYPHIWEGTSGYFVMLNKSDFYAAIKLDKEVE